MRHRSYGLTSAIFILLVGCLGPTGPGGEQGVPGEDGAPGAGGADGTNGVDGTNGADGADGIDGVDGTNGSDGTNGVDGTNGADGTNAATSGALVGLVTEAAEGTPVEGALVTFSPDMVPATTTDANGEYAADLPFGVYDVTVTYQNWPAANGTISVIAGAEQVLDLEFQNWNPRSDTCLLCHETSDPGLVAEYKNGKMAQEVSCQDCHGESLSGGPGHNPLPTPQTCAACHPNQFRGHQSNRHSIGMQRVYEAGRYDDLPPCTTDASGADLASGGVANCTQCHNVESKCDSCHTRHRFEPEMAVDPLACATCHMGPDHSQYEIYSTSKHGQVYDMLGPAAAPSCASCHMPTKRVAPDGTVYTDHDLSFGIAWGPVGGQPSHRSLKRDGQLPYVVDGGGQLQPNPAFDPNKPADMAGADSVPDSAFPEDRDGALLQFIDTTPVLDARREQMLGVCDRCHAADFATYRLEVADGMHENAHKIADEASDILKALYFDGLLLPPVPPGSERPSNPDAAPNTLVLGGPMLYRNLTQIERYYFKLYKYDFVKTWHGAYHFNPDYTHWYGWAEMNLTFADIADEAYDKRRDHALEWAIENGATDVWDVPYQGVYWNTGTMDEVYDLFPASSNVCDASGSGTPTTYTGLTFH